MSASAQLYAVLLGLRGDTLLVPNVGVVEVTSREGLAPRPGAPGWFAGTLDWQGGELAVLDFEELNRDSQAPPQTSAHESGRRRRLAVLNAVGSQLPGGRFGVYCEGQPHLVTLNRGALRRAEPRPQDRADCVLARVRLANTEAAIPNLAQIERALAAVLAA